MYINTSALTVLKWLAFLFFKIREVLFQSVTTSWSVCIIPVVIGREFQVFQVKNARLSMWGCKTTIQMRLIFLSRTNVSTSASFSSKEISSGTNFFEKQTHVSRLICLQAGAFIWKWQIDLWVFGVRHKVENTKENDGTTGMIKNQRIICKMRRRKENVLQAIFERDRNCVFEYFMIYLMGLLQVFRPD